MSVSYGPGEVSGWGDKNREKSFPDPWQTYSSQELPRTLSDIFDWCEALWYRNSTYRKAMERVASYFLTGLDISGCGDDEMEKYQDYFNNTVDLLGQSQAVAEDFLAYGNAYISIHFPFERFAQCTECRMLTPMLMLMFDFDAKSMSIHADCVHCKKKTEWTHVDRASVDNDGIQLVRWNVRDVQVVENPIAKQSQYWVKCPPEICEGVKSHDRFIISTTPWELLQCAAQDKVLRMHPDQLFHMREESLSGIQARGWGIPRVVSNMPQAYYIQVLKRLNEAQALDWIMPVRFMSPKAGTTGTDPFNGQNLGMYKRQIDASIKKSRFDPATWNYLPFPVEYQAIGGEGLQLATNQLIDAATDELLNGIGVPAELYRGTLQLQAMPTALRLFQQTWRPLVGQMNQLFTWIGHRVSEVKNWDKATLRLQPVTMADDVERKHVLLNLWGAQKVSAQTALSAFGVDAREEPRRIMDEMKHQSELEREFQREEMERQQAEEQIAALEMQQMPAAMPMGGMGGGMSMGPAGVAAPIPQPMAGMPATGAVPASGAQTPMDMLAQADELAQQLVQMPYPQRREQLTNLKDSNPALHAMVKQRMEDLRQDVASDAKASLAQG